MKWKVLHGDHYAYDGRGSIVASIKRTSAGWYAMKRAGFALGADGGIAWFASSEAALIALNDPATTWGWAGFGYGPPKNKETAEEEADLMDDAA